jgi:hypothetical protein
MNYLKHLLLAGCCCISVYSYAQPAVIDTNNTVAACESGCCCSSSIQAPAGIMTDHVHGKRQWMASYTYMNMRMQGNNTGTTRASDNTVYQAYAMAPETMTMQMHMAMLMYGVSDKLTIMAMGGYATYNMSMNMSSKMMSMPGMTMAMGDMTMKSASSGFTDTRISALYNVSNTSNHRLIASLGVDLPTGTIKATGTTMLGDNQRQPYDMQPGTGSFGIAPGITYVRNYTKWSWGADAGADIKLNRNSLGYKTGNQYHASAWGSYKLLPFVSASLRAEYVNVDKITGEDPLIAILIYQANDPTTNKANYGGQWLNAYAGLIFHFEQPVLNKFSLLAEYGMPAYQDLNGIQMALHSTLYATLQFSF